MLCGSAIMQANISQICSRCRFLLQLSSRSQVLWREVLSIWTNLEPHHQNTLIYA